MRKRDEAFSFAYIANALSKNKHHRLTVIYVEVFILINIRINFAVNVVVNNRHTSESHQKKGGVSTGKEFNLLF